jgi:hypothetical protein
MRAPTATTSARAHPGAPGTSSETTGPATTARITLTGTSIATVQVSRADAIRLVSAAPP